MRQMTEVPPLEKGCPWEEWTRPNLKWCENNLCEWVTTPANTYSNIPYAFFAILMWRQSRGMPTMRLFPIAMFLVGATSFFYHMSYTWVGQVIDFLGMFSFCVLCVTLNARRLQLIRDGSAVLLYYIVGCAITGLSIPLFDYLDLPIQLTVLLLVLLQVGQEIILRYTLYAQYKHLMPSYRRFLQSLATLALAFTCSLVDGLRIFCWPDNHVIQGHAAWHLISSLGLYLVFIFFKQFNFDNISNVGLPIDVVVTSKKTG